MIELLLIAFMVWLIWEHDLLQPIIVVFSAGFVITILGWWTILLIILLMVGGGLYEYYSHQVDKKIRGY